MPSARFHGGNISENVRSIAERVRDLVPNPMVIYSDVDGTLLGPGGCLFLDAERKLTLTPARAIVACHLHKLDVVLISGRSRAQLHGDARVFGFENWIAELGCQLVYNKGEVVIENAGPCRPHGRSVYRSIEESGAPRLLLDAYAGRLEYHLPWSENRECTHVMRGYVDVEEANSLLERAGHGDLKLVDNGRVHRTSLGLSLDLPEIHAYHLLPKESGKASAVRKDREIRNIPKDAAVAIGDAESDLELADEVALLFLVSNALTEDRVLAKRSSEKGNVIVTEHAMGLGWAEAIGYLTGACFFG